MLPSTLLLCSQPLLCSIVHIPKIWLVPDRQFINHRVCMHPFSLSLSLSLSLFSLSLSLMSYSQEHNPFGLSV